MRGPIARARGLVKSYGSGRAAHTVLAGVDLDVAPGELVAVLGRSGSGKSTLLHLLGGLDRPDRGTITVGGPPPDRLSERELAVGRPRGIGVVLQAFHLPPELAALGNVRLT